jgi:hypothetical protein
MLDIHQKAKLNFDNKGSELLFLIEEARPIQTLSTFSPDVHIKHHISDKDIISISSEVLVDGVGEEHGFFFTDNGKKYGIFGEKYKKLLKLTESISKTNNINNKISQKTIKEIIFEWVIGKSKRTINEDLVDYLIKEAKGKIVKQEVWIPIRYLHIESSLKVGRIDFKTITREMINGLETQWLTGSPDNEEEIKQFFEKDIRKIQGHAAATLTIEADRTRAEEIALEETKVSLLALKLFQPAAFHPKITSYYNIWGSESIAHAKFIFIEDNKLTSLNDQLLDKQYPLEMLDNARIKMHMDAGLSVLSELILNDKKNSFQQDVLDALFIYARCTMAKDPADKLVYVLVALESLFLRNNTESIQQNLAERMAFLIEKEVQERREVIKSVKKAYSIRSSFVHHGASIDDFESLEKFMLYAWCAILKIISATKSVKTKDELLDHLDELKLA